MAAFWITAFVIWIVCGFFTSGVASGKGHNGGSWFILGFLFGPLALLAAVGLSDKRRPMAPGAAMPGVGAVAEGQSEHEHHWVDSESVQQGTGHTAAFKKCAYCGLVKHEHQWSDQRASTKRKGHLYQMCEVCKEVSYFPCEHKWSDPQPSTKYTGKLYQACGACGTVRQIA